MVRPACPLWQRSPLVVPGMADEPLAPEFETFMNERAGRTPSTETRKRYRRHFSYFTEWLVATDRPLTMASVHYLVLREYSRDLASRPARPGSRPYDRPEQGMSPDTRRGYLTDLRTLCGYLVQAGWLVSNPFRITEPERLIPTMPSRPRPPRRVARPEQVDRLVAAIDDDSPAAMRDLAVTETIWATGLRRRDVAHLVLDQLDLERGLLRGVWEHKDGEDRHVTLSVAAVEALRTYLADGRPAYVAGGARRGADDPGWLFVSDHIGKRDNGDGRLTPSGIYQMLRRRSRGAGLPTVSPHAMRHGVGTVLGEANLSQHLIAAKLGHRQTRSTECYVEPSVGAVQRQVDPVLEAARATRRPARLKEVA